MKSLKVIFVSSEVVPFAKTGGLADVAGALPSALSKVGVECIVFLPFYKQTKAKVKELDIKLVKKDILIKFGQIESRFSLYKAKHQGIDFYLIDKNEYFNRDELYSTSTQEYQDNPERFAFFSKAVLVSSQVVGFKPDIIHCNDWQSALIPFYLKFNPVSFFSATKILFTIHNLAYQGLFSSDWMNRVGVDQSFFNPEALEFYGKFSFMKAGILYSDAVSTVSKGYAREILTKEFGCGLEGLLSTKKENLYGIVNGVDYTDWNPKVDKHIKAKYDSSNIADKQLCKNDLLSEFGMKMPKGAPVMGVISRLAEQKGIDIIVNAAEWIFSQGAGLVILGTGEEKYHQLLKGLKAKFPKSLGLKIAFDNAIAHKIEAGADMFLMPSRYEPCGLNQLYSLKYGTIPVVRAVGGLDDTILDYSGNKDKGNGFKFRSADTQSMLSALETALKVFEDKKQWEKLLKQAMSCDFSWKRSANEYYKLYSYLIDRNSSKPASAV